ncbi:MAG TPA: tetratricopeptide repeat protein [Methylophaga aminisulfidivorans]|uniref:tetratricopeptide repeat protein n=1 Tax=Methylophaga TaxID=40222 RepID=UPI001770FF4D|nr:MULTISPECIES: tetratricopeptide repeat protein [Methylophaga]HIC47640.1 tetratricopeptide repeat protein [Methylophaga sp.]HIM39029.1 tetratricopeptide repeat protein [Methylophaga aminisulfidivorans]
MSRILFYLFLSFYSLYASAADNSWQTLQTQATEAFKAEDYQTAETTIKQAIAITEKADNGAAYKASSLNLLAFIQEAQGQHEQAMTSLSTAVTLAKQVLASPDEQIATLLFNQGVLLQKNNQLNKADSVLGESIEQFQLSHSDGGGKLWQAILLRAQILISLGKQPQALNLISDTLSDATDKADDTPLPLSIESDLVLLAADIQLNEGQLYQAITSLEHMKKKLSHDTTSAAENLPALLSLLSRAYEKSGQADKAAATREQFVQLQNQGTPSMTMVMQLNELGLYQQQRDNLKQAEQYYQQALSQLSALGKQQSIEQATILGNLGSLQLAQHDFKAAETSLKQSLELYRHIREHPLQTAGIAGYLGTLYYNQRDFAKAETAFLTAVENLQKTTSENDGSLLLALQNLQSLYIAWGKSEKAAAYNRTIQDLKQRLQ